MMEGLKKEWPTSKPLRPLLPSTLPSYVPVSFPVSNKPHGFGNHASHFNSAIPFLSSSCPQDQSFGHDENSIFNSIINSNSPIKVETESNDGSNQLDPDMDPRKLRRIISNRVSAQKSRMKKIQYVTEMERRVKALQAKIAILHPQVVMYRNKQYLLEMEQKMLNHEISTCKSKKILKDGEIEENKAELIRLRKLYLVQQGENFEGQKFMFDSHQGGGEVGDNNGSDWSEESGSEEISNFAAALMEDDASKFVGIDQIFKL